MGKKPAYNSSCAIGWVSWTVDSLVVSESFVLRIKSSAKNTAHNKSANRYASCYNDTSTI